MLSVSACGSRVIRIKALHSETCERNPGHQPSFLVRRVKKRSQKAKGRQTTFRRGQPKIATASLTKHGVSHSGTRFHEDFAKFTRPHTILGTIISVSSVTMMAMQFGGVLEMSGALLFSKQTAQALVSAVLMNVAIVGINQVYDKKLDRVNKPYLPLASGAFSSDTALSIIAACTTLSLALGALSGSSALLFSLVVSLLLGIVYSVDYPGLRWKRSPVLAASCVLFVRAAIVQIGFFAHALGRGLLDFHLPKNLWFAIGFMAVYGVVIALFKDLPDVVGDKKHGFRTLGVRLGPSVVFNICVSLLAMAYGCAVILSVMYHSTTSTVLGVLHAAVIIPLLIASKRVDVSSSASLYGFYEKHIWRSFYLQYFLLPFCAFC
jgi:homogentisate phytyltransferase/homogentisate geranylgeranyltransferase